MANASADARQFGPFDRGRGEAHIATVRAEPRRPRGLPPSSGVKSVAFPVTDGDGAPFDPSKPLTLPPPSNVFLTRVPSDPPPPWVAVALTSGTYQSSIPAVPFAAPVAVAPRVPSRRPKSRRRRRSLLPLLVLATMLGLGAGLYFDPAARRSVELQADQMRVGTFDAIARGLSYLADRTRALK